MRRLLTELREARLVRGIAQSSMAGELGMSQPHFWRLENGQRAASVTRLAEMASVLGFELALSLHPIGDAIRDRGQQALIGRFRPLLSPLWQVTAEAPFPRLGDSRSWDLLLRLGAQRVGVEAETRIRDVQSLIRRIRGREVDGGADVVLLVLSDSAHNRRLVDELREALGNGWSTPVRATLRALRRGESLAGSGVVLL